MNSIANKVTSRQAEQASENKPCVERLGNVLRQSEVLEKCTLTLTLAEACELVGNDLEPVSFREQVFEVIARDLDVLSDLSERRESQGFDTWCAFQNLHQRIRLAGRIAAVIGGA